MSWLQVLSYDTFDVLNVVSIDDLQVSALLYSSRRDMILTGSNQGEIFEWDFSTLEKKSEMKIHSHEILRMVHFRNFLVVGTRWDNLSIW